jgi:hypothetical protein
MDAIVNLATAYGFLFIINPCETISIRDIAVANGATKCSTYGAWIGARYASYKNVIWIHGNDYQNWPTSDNVLIPIADGIRSSMPGGLQSVQLDFFDSDSGEDSAWWSHIDYNAVYLTANYSGTPDPTDGLRDLATAAKSADGHFALVYVPWTTNVICNLALMAGSVTAQWFDPTNGTYSSAGSGLTGSHSFTHPGVNSAGDPDRVLVLTA